MVILDTNIIIEHLRRHGQDSPLLGIGKKLPEEPFAISVISIQELFEGKSTRIGAEVHYLLETLKPLKILPYIFEVAEMAGKIARDLGRRIELPDAAIAATAITNGAALFTLNKKDFAGIKNLELVDIQVIGR